MELNGYRLLLPEGTLDYFDFVDVKESVVLYGVDGELGYMHKMKWVYMKSTNYTENTKVK